MAYYPHCFHIFSHGHVTSFAFGIALTQKRRSFAHGTKFSIHRRSSKRRSSRVELCHNVPSTIFVANSFPQTVFFAVVSDLFGHRIFLSLLPSLSLFGDNLIPDYSQQRRQISWSGSLFSGRRKPNLPKPVDRPSTSEMSGFGEVDQRRPRAVSHPIFHLSPRYISVRSSSVLRRTNAVPIVRNEGAGSCILPLSTPSMDAPSLINVGNSLGRQFEVPSREMREFV
ncbi:uncharacterized protein FOMMEDRAFT_159651 [Fomitiporia mediterranea MF3/22]|uniref:uncharacterized protein n=1 Tax=Fomitiporia mediterranea (strain MF3/22) TaxID=694068 RepID=UPI0004409004|nr:uncharacterized protein FOMMEDRAFT_159651 [Fomitiporia mediterranea MF3/22]EJD00056.1 hypothetical protein FOMMEDRAFT_159651 [Fomitiporia mediterranea MF3/22]